MKRFPLRDDLLILNVVQGDWNKIAFLRMVFYFQVQTIRLLLEGNENRKENLEFSV